MSDLQKEISDALNRSSAENDSNTPDFILANYLMGCLEVFNKTLQARNKWYGREDSPGGILEPCENPNEEK